MRSIAPRLLRIPLPQIRLLLVAQREPEQVVGAEGGGAAGGGAAAHQHLNVVIVGEAEDVAELVGGDVVGSPGTELEFAL